MLLSKMNQRIHSTVMIIFTIKIHEVDQGNVVVHGVVMVEEVTEADVDAVDEVEEEEEVVLGTVDM